MLLQQSEPPGHWAAPTRASPAEPEQSLSLSKLDRPCLEYSFDPCYTKKNRCGQVGKGPEKSHKDDPKPGKLPHEQALDQRLRTGCFNS